MITDKAKGILGLGAPEDGHVPVLWMDDTEWDLTELPKEQVPFDARASDFDGEWTYILLRQQKADPETGEVIVEYKPFPVVLPPNDHEVTQQRLYRSTDWWLFSNFLKGEPLDTEKVDKNLLIAVIIGTLIFGFLLIMCLIGGE